MSKYFELSLGEKLKSLNITRDFYDMSLKLKK